MNNQSESEDWRQPSTYVPSLAGGRDKIDMERDVNSRRAFDVVTKMLDNMRVNFKGDEKEFELESSSALATLAQTVAIHADTSLGLNYSDVNPCAFINGKRYDDFLK